MSRKEMDPEVYFIKYAYPCAHILCSVRGDVTQEEYGKMKEAAVENKKLDRDYLERVFFRAFDRIKKIAEEMGRDKWDVEVLREYFVERHNAVLDGSDYPESFKEMCKVFEGKIIGVEDGEFIVSYSGGKKRKVKGDYFKDLKLGEGVMIHWQYIVEKV